MASKAPMKIANAALEAILRPASRHKGHTGTNGRVGRSLHRRNLPHHTGETKQCRKG